MSDEKVIEFRPKQQKIEEEEDEFEYYKELFYEYLDEIGITDIDQIIEIVSQFKIKMALIFDMGAVQFIREVGGLFSESARKKFHAGEEEEENEDEDEEAVIDRRAIEGLAAVSNYDLFGIEEDENNLTVLMRWLADARQAYEYFEGEKPNVYEFIVYELRNMGELE